jgi:glucuronoarabinoxylan endo-1,4-beta-xylanase
VRLTPRSCAVISVLLYAQRGEAQTATIDPSVTHQGIDGFGAANAYEPAPLTSAQAEFWFGTASGDIGLSLLRTEIPNDGSCSSVGTSCAGTYVSDMKIAAPYGVKVWSAPWSPPASMKSNGTTICSTSTQGSLNASSYAAYATYLTNYVKSLGSMGVTLYALSIQNEPDYCPSTYDGAVWSASDFDTFIGKNLGPAFAAAGLSTLIMMPESSQWASFASVAGTTMGDPAAAKYVGINAWHDYDHASSITNPYASLGKKFWETEASAGIGFGPTLCGGCWDPSMADGLLWAGIIDDRMAVADANAWHYWWLVDPGSNDNEGLTGPDGVTIPKRAYVLGNYSRFVRPGFQRIDATHAPQSGVLVSAYKGPSGDLVIVAVNQNGSSTSQPFAVSSASPTSFTPWTTDASSNLAGGAPVAVTGGSFTYALTAQSVTTFVWTSPAARDAGAGDGGAPARDGGSKDSGSKDSGSPVGGREGGSGRGDGSSGPGASGPSSGGCGCRASARGSIPVPTLFALVTLGTLVGLRRRTRVRESAPFFQNTSV